MIRTKIISNFMESFFYNKSTTCVHVDSCKIFGDFSYRRALFMLISKFRVSRNYTDMQIRGNACKNVKVMCRIKY